MPVLKVYRHGVTAGCPPAHSPTPPDRTKCAGWSVSAIRRNRLFLYSVDDSALDGVGFAFTGTVRTCPATHDDWKKGREAFFVRLRRSGMIRSHWLTEWQRRGMPHLHMAVWFPADVVGRWVDRDAFGRWLVLQWMQAVGDRYGARDSGQHVTPIYNVVGWNQYVSKHAARGLSHYQRNPACIPEGWRNVGTGRMWGRLGDWPLVDPADVELSMAAFHALRRIVRGYRKADARSALVRSRELIARARNPSEDATAHAQARTARRRIVQARGMLQARAPSTIEDGVTVDVAEASRRRSTVRGVSEWLPQEVQLRALAHLARMGHDLSA
ncbi:hypothetical protein L0E83_16550 [Marichromatium gracile]|uniref:hypothetical protein n=1 Tax=Marichromatium gracile TaxID=1048 RepID=UPI001F3324BF|nr:hypothetical protein [Marichromatium gracile]MCF1185039.1 hypothetical protein [Marichromatium gracile]